MRKYNRDGQVLVMTTIQAYLKSSRQTVEEYIRLAQKEGWSLGIKLVRGAYIGSDVRSKIHDTKPETDASFNWIAHDIITKSWPGFDKANFPHVRIFLAGHNTESIRKASTLVQRLAQAGQLSEEVHYGQLQGMADDIGCELLAIGDQAKHICSKASSKEQFQRTALGAPYAYKCLTWGSIKDCLHYLVRRAIENQGAAERMNASLEDMKKELRKRVLRF
jgi:proline dehydrogenase